MIHAAHDYSPRLWPVLVFLVDRGERGATTSELQRVNSSMAPATDVSELRARGHMIERRYEGVRRGRRVNRYYYQGRNA